MTSPLPALHVLRRPIDTTLYLESTDRKNPDVLTETEGFYSFAFYIEERLPTGARSYKPTVSDIFTK